VWCRRTRDALVSRPRERARHGASSPTLAASVAARCALAAAGVALASSACGAAACVAVLALALASAPLSLSLSSPLLAARGDDALPLFIPAAGAATASAIFNFSAHALRRLGDAAEISLSLELFDAPPRGTLVHTELFARGARLTARATRALPRPRGWLLDALAMRGRTYALRDALGSVALGGGDAHAPAALRVTLESGGGAARGALGGSVRAVAAAPRRAARLARSALGAAAAGAVAAAAGGLVAAAAAAAILRRGASPARAAPRRA
jgi:hypothetical protein